MLVSAGLLGSGAVDPPGGGNAAPAAAVQGLRPADRGDVGAIYAAASPGVVSVRTSEGSGTGFVVDRNGTLVTNAHVVGSAQRVQVQFEGDGPAVGARVVGSDRSSDVAVLRVDPDEAPALRPLAFADSDQVEVGQLAVAIGSPFGLDQTATSGIVSGLEREIRAPDGFQIDKVIQTDAPINPGNSGGPLLDARGRVIGINSQIAATNGASSGNVGIGFAVPANTVKEIYPRLARGEAIQRPYLGVSTEAAAGGVRVGEVTAGGPAAAAGLRAGDLVVDVAGTRVSAPDDVSAAIESRRPGQRLDVVLERDGDRRPVTVTLGTRPAQTP
jgi:putative serine protease PepD